MCPQLACTPSTGPHASPPIRIHPVLLTQSTPLLIYVSHPANMGLNRNIRGRDNNQYLRRRRFPGDRGGRQIADRYSGPALFFIFLSCISFHNLQILIPVFCPPDASTSMTIPGAGFCTDKVVLYWLYC